MIHHGVLVIKENKSKPFQRFYYKFAHLVNYYIFCHLEFV